MSDHPDIETIKDFDPVVEVLIAQLCLKGLLDDDDLATMARRLNEIGRLDLAMAVKFLPTANAHDEPEPRRAGIHLVHDGGNATD